MKYLFLVLSIFCFANCHPKITPVVNDEFRIDHRQVVREIEYIEYIKKGGRFELPVAGASGYAAVNLPVYGTVSENAGIIYALKAGQGFIILNEVKDWWQIEINAPDHMQAAMRGYVVSKYCLINLPDIIPSIIFNNTNTYSSMLKSSGIDIPNITGNALYNGKDFNNRLGREEFIAPVLYGMAGKIFAAQQAALADGNTLIIYEAFRPSAAHDYLHEHFSNLVNTNEVVLAGITADSFNIRWFLAEAPYNHQRGTAIDVSLGRIVSKETRATGVFLYTQITEYTEYPMQTDIHELSVEAAVFSSSVHARSATAWIGAPVSERATPGTILLQKYNTDAGLTPLASEWWHFNDLENTAWAIEIDNIGEYLIEKTYSSAPVNF